MSWYAYFSFCFNFLVLSGISIVQYNTAFLFMERCLLLSLLLSLSLLLLLLLLLLYYYYYH